MENYQQVALLIDEMIDEGIVINTDSEHLENNVYIRDTKTAGQQSAAASGGSGYFSSVSVVIYCDIIILYFYNVIML